MTQLNKSMVLDGIATSSAIDSSSEQVDIDGMSIESLQDGSAILNWEHQSPATEGPLAAIGAITFAKKIYSPKDCDDDRQLMYWNSIQLPFVYIQAELFDGEGHEAAKAAAALVRYYHRRKLPVVARYSVEGSTVERKGQVLSRCISKSVALTLRPCNRSCISGVISDSETPEVKDPLETLKFENPNRQRLAFHESTINPMIGIDDPLQKMRDAIDELHEINALRKDLSIGAGDGRPSAMTGGAALQAESFGDEKKKKFIKNQALAAVRDWKGRGDLTKFLKHRLPDASEEFIQHFARLVDDIHLKKAIELENNLLKAITGQPAAASTPATPLESVEPKSDAKPKTKSAGKWKQDEDGVSRRILFEEHAALKAKAAAPEVDDSKEALTIRGRKVRPTKHLQAHFDERTGTLHTPRGNFKMYLPQNDPHPGALESFMNALNDPKATKFHDYAIANWMKVHKMLKAGTLPPEVIMHSALFSMNSPNTPVAMQEHQYSKLVDTMNEAGIDARSPQFASLKDAWVDRDSPTELPTHSRGHFEGSGPGSGIFLKNPSKLTGRAKGEISGYMLANNKFANMEQYHKLHPALVELFGRHQEDGRALVAELMAHKNKAKLWSAHRARQTEKGQPDPGEYNGPSAPGLAPKTARYMASMAGAGNCLDAETEALTQRGWINGFDLTLEDVILTKNAKTNQLEWQNMTHLYQDPNYEGPMVEFKSRSFHAITTPNHRWLVTSKVNSEGRGGVVKEKTSATITMGVDQIHRTGDFIGPQASTLTPDEAELLGWFVTDGYFKFKKVIGGDKNNRTKYKIPGKYCYVCQSPTGNPEKTKRISQLIKKLDGKKETIESIHSTKDLVNWNLGPTLTELIEKHAPNRCLTINTILGLDKPALERLFESMILGDGSISRNEEEWSDNVVLYTGRLEQVNAFQLLCTLLGKASSSLYRDLSNEERKQYKSMGYKIPKSQGIYVVHAHVRKFTLVETHHVQKLYGKFGIWCPTVPNSFFIARRDGQVWVTGNSHVPDTHFIRYLFGLEKGPDTRSISYLKSVMWNEKNAHILDGIDRFYAANHPAVQHMMDHPVFGKQFASREDAIFPAFWKNWAAIVPHEKARGMKTGGFNEGTDHRPFWEAIHPYINKAESDLVQGTINTHAKWAEEFGEIPAQMLYFAYLVPQLLRAQHHDEEPISKMERIATDLRKAAQEMTDLPQLAHGGGQNTQEFRGRKVVPGEIEVMAGPYKGSKMHFLGSAHGQHFVRPPSGGDISLLSQSDEGTGYKINSGFTEFHPAALVDANKHSVGSHNKLQAQRALIHGIDIKNPHQLGEQGITADIDGTTGWYKNYVSKMGYVKPDVNEPKFWSSVFDDLEDPTSPGAREYIKSQMAYSLPHREALFHNMAQNFFGVGQHVPTTAVFNHPETNKPMSVMEKVPGKATHFDSDNDDHGAMLHQAYHNGTLDKLALTDYMMGNVDRHASNYMLSNRAPGIHAIDNGLALDYQAPLWNNFMWVHHHSTSPDVVPKYDHPANPDRKDQEGGMRQVHPQTVDWMLGLKPEEFSRQMAEHGVPPRLIQEGVDRMKIMQAHANIMKAANQPVTRASIKNAISQHLYSRLA